MYIISTYIHNADMDVSARKHLVSRTRPPSRNSPPALISRRHGADAEYRCLCDPLYMGLFCYIIWGSFAI